MSPAGRTYGQFPD